MVILGLTGSIGMGKTTAAKVFRRLGVPVYDADQAVHDLMGPGGAAVSVIEAHFSNVTAADGSIDRQALGAQVFSDHKALILLENILHPLVGVTEDRFLRQCARLRVPTVVLDIPLLFETHGQYRCDAVAVVSAPRAVQRRRVLRRPGMTPDKLASILSRQMPDDQKRRRADFVVQTGLGRNNSLRSITAIVKTISRWRGQCWPPNAYRRTHHA